MLIYPTARLMALPDPERDKAWRRMWGQIMRADPGEGFQLFRLEERSGPFHRRHRVILERLFQAQERSRPMVACSRKGSNVELRGAEQASLAERPSRTKG